MHNSPIGIIDSGVGGLSIWKAITSLLPQESTIYLADQKRLPYGEKSIEELFSYGQEMIDFLLKQQVKGVVIACNTLTVSALDRLREVYPDLAIIGTVPVVKSAAEKTKSGVISILSTERTASSAYQQALIEKFAPSLTVLNIGSNKLVPFIENGEVEGEGIQRVVGEILEPLKGTSVDVLALGCTHYPFLHQIIQENVGEEVLLLDSGAAVGRQVQRILQQNHAVGEGLATHAFYTTGDPAQFTRVSRLLLNTPALQACSQAVL